MYNYEVLWLIEKWKKGIVSMYVRCRSPFLITQSVINVHLDSKNTFEKIPPLDFRYDFGGIDFICE